MSEEAEPVQTETPEAPKPKKTQKTLVRNIVIGVVVVVAAVFGIRTLQFNATHITTDDAYVTNDIISISPEEIGKVASVPALLNKHVNAGDPLVTLENQSFAADLKQAEATLAVAQAA
ncbi:MAG: biotin/lipoyl-binding protein, partial [bacterium]